MEQNSKYCFYALYCLEEVAPDMFKVSLAPSVSEIKNYASANRKFVNRMFPDIKKEGKRSIRTSSISTTLSCLDSEIVTTEEIRNITLTRLGSPNVCTQLTKRRNEVERELSSKFDGLVTGIDKSYWKDAETLSIYYNLISSPRDVQVSFARTNRVKLAKEAIEFIKNNPTYFYRVRNIDRYKPVMVSVCPGAQIEVKFEKRHTAVNT